MLALVKRTRIRSGVFQDDLRLISSTITSVAIDGKKITNPVGFSGGKVMLTVLNVFAPASEFNIVRSIIASLGRKNDFPYSDATDFSKK